MTLTNSPDLYVNILQGAPSNANGVTDRFRVEGQANQVRAFYKWWNAEGITHLAEVIATGYPFILCDDGDGFGVGGDAPTLNAYLRWRDSMRAELELGLTDEPALAIAA